MNNDIARKIKYEETADVETQLPKYTEIKEVINFKTRYYMIDFKDIRHIKCTKVLESEKDTDKDILKSIVLQLSDNSREELRNKMGYYFARPPEKSKF